MTPKQYQSFGEISFDKLSETLIACGRIVVREIIQGVKSRTKPDGSPQKANAPSTVKAKGHDHPVVEKRHRFEQPSTYLVAPIEENTVAITILSPTDSEIAAGLDERGYEFFGITDKAADEAYDIMDAYLAQEIGKQWGNK